MTKDSKSNKKTITVPRIIRPETRREDMNDVFNHLNDEGGLFWQNWLIAWDEFLAENKSVSAVRLSREKFQSIDGHIYQTLKVSVLYL